MEFPLVPEVRVLLPDHFDHSNIARGTHITSDSIETFFIKRIIRSILSEKIQPDMQCRPVLDGCGRDLVSDNTVFKNPAALLSPE
jgi:hypothetical protein